LNNLYLSTTSGTISLASGLVIGGLFSNIDSASHILVRYVNGSKFPPGFSNTYVKATTEYSSSYAAHIATNPNISLTGTYAGASWISANGSKTDQRFHIDLGTAKVIDRIYYENLHHLGGVTNRGAKNFTFWGSNSAADFADLVYANDGTWVQLTTDVSQFKQHIASDIPDPKYVNVKNTTAYRYYAFKFDDNWGYAGFMGVRRIELQQTSVETQAVITLLPGGTQNLRMVDATNIDSSAGQTIISVGGILSNTLNWSN